MRRSFGVAGNNYATPKASASARVVWPAADVGAMWVLTDGLGKAAFDGAAQRIAATCVLRQRAGTELRITNPGSTPMRVLRWAPVDHDPPAAATEPAPQA